MSSLARYLGDPDPYADPSADPSADPAAGLTVTSSRQLGGVHLLDGLWHQLGIDTALAELLGERRFTTDAERVLFALVANRALDPGSKRAAVDWAVHYAAITGITEVSDDQAYRGDGPAGRGRRHRAGAGGGVLLRRESPEPGCGRHSVRPPPIGPSTWRTMPRTHTQASWLDCVRRAHEPPRDFCVFLAGRWQAL